MRDLRRYLLLWLILLVTICSNAQSPDDDDLDEPDASASLSLNFDREGSLQASIFLPHGAKPSETLPALLARALHCPAGALTHPAGYDFPLEQIGKNWSAARKDRYRKQMEEFNLRRLSGHCNSVLSRRDLLLEGDFDYSPVVPELHRIGVDQLSVYVALPKTQFRDYSQAQLVRLPVSRAVAPLLYQIPITENFHGPVLHLAFGFRRTELHRALLILAAFIFIPVLITLWMGRKALASAEVDAAAAWFGFMRTLNWLVTGTMLVWITSAFGARQTLQEWIAAQRLSSLKAAFADVTVAIVPAFLVYFLCLALSYSVHVKLRGRQWTRREFMLRQLTTVGAQAIPLMLGIAGIEMLHKENQLAAALLISAVFVSQGFQILKLRVLKEFPQPLTTGGLRDRVFQLAGKLGVSVNQIFILPARKGQIANAFAAKNRIVMFTDYLLEHLTKQEVDGVAAHELAHLRFNHPAKLGAALMAAIFLPHYFVWLAGILMDVIKVPFGFLPAPTGSRVFADAWKGLNAFEQWSQKDLVLLVLGMAGFYFLSRHFEYVADATAVRLTGNPEAQITSLLKLSRLNLTPIRWGKASESWLTHPSTVRRAHRMAAAGGLATERVQKILYGYDEQGSSAKVVPPEDRYYIPPAGDPEKLRAALNDRTRTQGKLWASLASYVIPPAISSIVIHRIHLGVWETLGADVMGVVVTAFLVTLAAVWLGESGRGAGKMRLRQRFEAEHVPVGTAEDIAVGFAPGPYPRLYGARYHWDAGFLVLSKDRLQFVGEQVKFALSPSEIDGLVIDRGGPSWWKYERVYVHWKTEDGRNGIFNLNSLEPGSTWQTRTRVRKLYDHIQRWREQPLQHPDVRPGLQGLKTLELGQVTSISPRNLGNANVNIKVLSWLLLLAIGMSMLIQVDMWYMCLSVIAVRLALSIPYWRYQDRVPALGSARDGSARARCATAGTT